MSTCCSWLLINYISAHCLLLWFHLISWNTLSVVFHTQHTWGTWSISTLYTHEISAPGMLRPLCCGWVVVDDDDNVTLDDLSANLINCLILLHLLPWIPFNLSLNSIKLFAHNFHNFSICLLNAANMILIGFFSSIYSGVIAKMRPSVYLHCHRIPCETNWSVWRVTLIMLKLIRVFIVRGVMPKPLDQAAHASPEEQLLTR